jgi:hypothetical protein
MKLKAAVVMKLKILDGAPSSRRAFSDANWG